MPKRRSIPAATSLAPASQLQLPLDPLTVRIPVAMRLTGIGRSKLYELIKAGDLQTVKIGTATLVTMASLRRLVERGSA